MLMCKELGRAGASVLLYETRRYEYVSLKYFGMSTRPSHCGLEAIFTDVLKTDSRLNYTETSAAT
jgi:hypothetical protein